MHKVQYIEMSKKNDIHTIYTKMITIFTSEIRQSKFSGLPHSGCYESAVMLRGSALVVECRRSRVARFILLGRHPLPPRLRAAQCIQPLCKQILALLPFHCLPTAYYQNFCLQNFPLSSLTIDLPTALYSSSAF